MTNPISTYRFQFNNSFRFEDFEKIISYMQQLGVGTIYASPIFEAVQGSTHGYDGINPCRINPEIGTLEQLKAISQQLKASSISWLQDIVPNHMAFHSKNEWLMDVLEKGPQSQFGSFFDITWSDPSYKGRLMVPFLGATLDEVIANSELKIDYRDQRLVFKYYDATYPLQPLSYVDILKPNDQETPDAVKQLMLQLPKMEDEKDYAEAWSEMRLQLAGLMQNQSVHNFVETCIEKVNSDHQLLKKIESQQSYRLCHWQETDQQINYRRFFTVNGLICLNIQDENVFNQYHQLVEALVKEGVVGGLRIDHIDGLYNPTAYLERLRTKNKEQFIIVEKILEPGESLPAQWPIQGNTGYDFLSLVNNLFTNQKAEKLFTRFYRQITRDNRSVEEQIHDKKSSILFNHMGGELDNLYHLFMNLNIVEKKIFAMIRTDDLKAAIGEFLIHCPVYRFYGTSFPLASEESEAVREVLYRVRKYNRELRRAVDILEEVLLKKPLEANEEINKKIAHFYQRCMQFTGPLMAKGVEDTLMYTYNRFIGHNEVGDAPAAFGISPETFHEAMIARQKRWPLSLNGTSTHDTKRGEDTRARLNVITDIDEEWVTAVKEWRKMNEALKKDRAPYDNDEYFIYQVLLGAWPMQEEENFSERIAEYLKKALREAKLNSNWTSPNETYESTCVEFALALINKINPFHKSFSKFYNKLVDHGIVNSLSQLILKFTCPGVPDVYQGCELWDFSLVDPDNRRAVDYEKRNEWLKEIQNQSVESLWQER
ncbi:MAG: malto-oligosyltrehalose synthase, partial [Flavisolibacter sp.]